MTRPLALLGLPMLLVMLCAADEKTPPQIAKAFGNTIVSTYPDGRKGELWLEPSGHYTAMGRRHDRSSGHWSIKDDQLCLKQSHPVVPPFFHYCTPIPTGDSWTAKAFTGETIQVRLVRGRKNG